MPIPTRRLTIRVTNAMLADVSGVRCSAELISLTGAGQVPFLSDRRTVVPLPVATVTDAAGSAGLDLVPSRYIAGGWLYRITLRKDEFEASLNVYMLDGDSDLFDLIEIDAFDIRPSLPVGEVGWLVQDAAPANPLVGHGWLRPGTSDLQVWNGAAFASVAGAGAGTNMGPEWARLTLPSGTFASRTPLNLPVLPTKEPGAPTQLSVHAGAGRNVRITPDWAPAAEQIGWWLVPYVGGVAFPHRVFYPLHTFQFVFLVFVNTAAPATFFRMRGAHRLERGGRDARPELLSLQSDGRPARGRFRAAASGTRSLTMMRTLAAALVALVALVAPAAAQVDSDLPALVIPNSGETATEALTSLTVVDSVGGEVTYSVGAGSAISVLDESVELTDSVTSFVFTGTLIHCSASGTTVVCQVGTGGTPPTPTPPQPYNGYIGWSDDSTATAAELQAGNTFTTTTATIPMRSANGYLIFGLEDGWPNGLYFMGNSYDVLGGFTQQGTLDVGGTTHTVGVSNALQSASMIGTGSFTIRFVR